MLELPGEARINHLVELVYVPRDKRCKAKIDVARNGVGRSESRGWMATDGGEREGRVYTARFSYRR